MIVNKSMFPLQTGFGVISQMQDKFATLQMQLGTGDKASKLSEMGRDLPMSLSVRSRLSRIEGFSSNIDTVNLRLSFLDKTMTRMDAIEGEARNSAVQGQYGTNNINMATLPGLSQARFDEMVTLLNSDVAGRYLFGGANTDSAPLPTSDVLLNGQSGRAGFKTVVSERVAADAGTHGLGRVLTGVGATPDDNKVSITEDGIHPFGLKLSNFSNTATGAAVIWSSGPSPITPDPNDQLGQTGKITFNADPTQQIKPGETMTLGFTLPDGETTQVVMTAVAQATVPPTAGQFVVGTDPVANAASFKTALDVKLNAVAAGDLAAASTVTAAKQFFNSPGEPVLRVAGNNPAEAKALRVGTALDTVQWYSGQSPSIAAANQGRLDVSSTGATVTLARRQPLSDSHGFQISGATGPAGVTVTPSSPSDPSSLALTFTSVPAAGDEIELTLLEPPNDTARTISLKGVSHSHPGPGEFAIGATPAATAANFKTALGLAVGEAATAAEGNPRQSVGAQVDDNTRVSYGVQANESGFLAIMRSTAAMSVVTYADGDDASARDKFDAMARRQQAALSEGHNSERGSVEILTMELAVASRSLDTAAKRHTDYKAQLDNLLSDVETVSKEDVAMEILALQTRLTASYQATSMISKLSLVNFI